jgi:rubredoxin
MTPRIDFEAEGFVPFLAEGDEVRGECRCSACGYGAIVAGPLPACPMCRGTAWEAVSTSPFERREAPRPLR